MPARLTRRHLGRFAVAGCLLPIGVARGEGAIGVHRYTQPGRGSVNSWILEGEDAVVLVDAQRTLSAGRAVADMIADTGKPLAATLITHPHPDHFGGLTSVLARFPDTPVLATGGTIAEMREDGQGFMAATRAALPDDSPTDYPIPDHMVVDAEELSFGALTLRIDDIGAGEAEAMAMVYAPEANLLITGDLINNGMTAFLLEGRPDAWLGQLDTVERAYATRAPTILPGHGDPGGFAPLLDAQRVWLETLIDLVQAAVADGAVNDDDAAAIAVEMETRYPGALPVADIPDLMALNIGVLAGRQ